MDPVFTVEIGHFCIFTLELNLLSIMIVLLSKLHFLFMKSLGKFATGENY